MNKFILAFNVTSMPAQRYGINRDFCIFASMKVIYVILGYIALGLGFIGAFLPLLPTTPFLILAAALFFRGSPKTYRWLLSQKKLGTYIRNFRENRAIPLHAKIVSVTLVWVSILYCVGFVATNCWLKMLLLVIAAGISFHILSFKTLK